MSVYTVNGFRSIYLEYYKGEEYNKKIVGVIRIDFGDKKIKAILGGYEREYYKCFIS